MNKSGQNTNHQPSNGSTSLNMKNMYNRQLNNPQSKAITPKNNMNITDAQRNFNTINVGGAKNMQGGNNRQQLSISVPNQASQDGY